MTVKIDVSSANRFILHFNPFVESLMQIKVAFTLEIFLRINTYPHKDLY